MRHTQSYPTNKFDTNYTHVITAFLRYNDKILLLKRSNKVKTMKELWSGISGRIEGDEDPLYRAKREIFEEVGISEDKITLVKSANKLEITSPEHANYTWVVFPFLFDTNYSNIQLNWENSTYKWINSDELDCYNTVPSLDLVLFSLL